MENGNPERRLAAIVAIDVVGFSRLMGDDENATFSVLKSHQEALTLRVQSHGGRVANTAGDGFLLEFPSVVEALECAIDVQAAMAEQNSGIPEDKKMLFRIGINVGDVLVHTDDDIFGDGVNVAARIEALAPAGGICISRSVRNQVRDKMDVNLEDMGEIEVKNIARPIRVFRVLKEGEIATAPLRIPPAWRKYVAVAAVMIALVGGGGGLWWLTQPDFAPAYLEKYAFSIPDKPSIAVLPFDNLSGDKDQEYFADGMTDDLITDLSKLSSLFVISRNSTFSYKGSSVKIRKVAEELGVRYVLEGSVRRVGDNVRINAQLIDALSGYHVWAERYDGSLGDVFKLQDNVIGQIVAALSDNLTFSDTALTKKVETSVPAAYDAFLQGRDHYRRQTPQDYATAIGFFNKALELDDSYSRAHAFLAKIYYSAQDTNWDVHLDIEYKAMDLAKYHLAKALEMPTSDALQVAAEMLYDRGQNEEALAEISRAIALEPNNASSYVTKARVLVLSGRAEEAEINIRQSMRLNPDYGASTLRALGKALFYQRRHPEAIKIMERAVNLTPEFEFAYRTLAAIYGHLDRIKEAKEAVKKYNALTGETFGDQLTIKRVEIIFSSEWLGLDKIYLAHLLDGLRKAGVPESTVMESTKVNYVDLVKKADGEFNVKGALKINTTKAKALFDRGVVFIDSRGSGPYSRGHIPSAVNIHLSDLSRKELFKLVKPELEVVFYCGGEDCSLSPKSCAKALVWGYSKVYYFAEGYPAWKDAGYQVEKL